MAATTVVASAYDTSGNGGRKLVRLTNGWLVAGVVNGTTSIIFYKSIDNGASWSQLCFENTGNTVQGFAIASSGTMVYLILAVTGDSIARSHKFDATTVTNTDLNPVINLDTSQSSFGPGCSLTIDGNGHLHATWSSKNATYPNSFNIRYSKSTDGGATWAAPTQITTYNTTGADDTNPCIAVRSNNYPSILYQETNGAGTYRIECKSWNGSSWGGAVDVISIATYTQSNPCCAVDSNDNIHVVWHGTDSTDNSFYNARYAKSTDGGATWKKADGTAGHDKLTSGNAYVNAVNTSITIDKSNNLYVFFQGIDAAYSTTYGNIKRKICTNNVWGATTTLTNNTTGAAIDVQTLWSKFNMNSDDAVRWIYRDLQAPIGVKYDSLKLLWSHKLLGITPSKIMGMQPSKVMGIQ